MGKGGSLNYIPSMMGLPDTLAGFRLFPVTYPSKNLHIIYGKAHDGFTHTVDNALPVGRTLFLVNIPPDATERELTLLFKSAGVVERIIFDRDNPWEVNPDSDSDGESADEAADEPKDSVDRELPAKKRKKTKKDNADIPVLISLPVAPLRTLRQTGRIAHIVFLDVSSLARALVTPPKPRAWPNSTEPRGFVHYTALHDALRPPLDTVRAHADSAIAVFDYEQARRRQKSQYRKGDAIVDQDGFTLVTRGGAYGQTLGGGVGVATKKFHETGISGRRRKKKDGNEKEGLYAFQGHEKKRKAMLELKRKWEEDKAKVAELQKLRRFKPY